MTTDQRDGLFPLVVEVDAASGVPAFLLPRPVARLDDLTDEEAPPEECERLVAADVLADVRHVSAPQATVRVCTAGVGVGIGGTGLVLELMGYVADFGGTVVVLRGAAIVVRDIYSCLQRHFGGDPPMLSRGAAAYLAAAGLCERIGRASVEIVSARAYGMEPSYRGVVFFVIELRSGDRLFEARVDPHGRCTFRDGPTNDLAD